MLLPALLAFSPARSPESIFPGYALQDIQEVRQFIRFAWVNGVQGYIFSSLSLHVRLGSTPRALALHLVHAYAKFSGVDILHLDSHGFIVEPGKFKIVANTAGLAGRKFLLRVDRSGRLFRDYKDRAETELKSSDRLDAVEYILRPCISSELKPTTAFVGTFTLSNKAGQYKVDFDEREDI